MVVSVSNNISEALINEFFHNTEISVLNIYHEMEIYNARYKYLNEAESEQKKDSVFKKFVETIKQKAIELFNKVYHTIQALYRNHMSSKYMTLVRSRKVNIDEGDVVRHAVFHAQRRDGMYTRLEKSFYDINGQIPISDKMKNDIITGKLKSVIDFMFKFEVKPKNMTRAIMAKNNIIDFNDKEFKQEKNKFLEEIDSAYKSDEYTPEEKTEIIKRLMNFYTAILKCQIYNVQFWINQFNSLVSEKEYEIKMNAQIDSDHDEYFESFKKAVISGDFLKATELILGVLDPYNYLKKEANKCYNFVDQNPDYTDFWEVGGKYNDPKNFEIPRSRWDEYHLYSIMSIFRYHRTRELYQYMYKVAETVYKYRYL